MIQLGDGEQTLWEGRPASRVLWAWGATKWVGWMVFVGFFTFAGGTMVLDLWLDPKGPVPWPKVAALLRVVVPLAGLVGVAYLAGLRRTYRYLVTNQRCVLAGGLLIRRRRSVHYHKVTDVEVSQNPIERLLGLGSLKLYTAGTSSFTAYPWGPWERAEITFEGLQDPAQPEQIVNQTLKRYRATGE